MLALLIAHVVGKLVSAQNAILRRVEVVADAEVAQRGANLNPAQADAGDRVAAIFGGRNLELVAVKAIRETEVVYQFRGENGSQADQPLRRDVLAGDPVRGQENAVGGVEVVVVIVAQADKCAVLAAQLGHVNAQVGLRSRERVGRDDIELRKDRMSAVVDRKDAVLIVVLHVEEPEERVLFDRAADAAACSGRAKNGSSREGSVKRRESRSSPGNAAIL